VTSEGCFELAFVFQYHYKLMYLNIFEVFDPLSLSLFFAVLGLELRAFSHSTSPFFVKSFFEIGSHGTICLGWLQTAILLISDS
jgi:hypothetical protein